MWLKLMGEKIFPIGIQSCDVWDGSLSSKPLSYNYYDIPSLKFTIYSVKLSFGIKANDYPKIRALRREKLPESTKKLEQKRKKVQAKKSTKSHVDINWFELPSKATEKRIHKNNLQTSIF